jgi:PAS domain S-box-containing protein
VRWTESKAALYGVALTVVLLLANAGVSQWTTHRLVQNEEWVTHTRHVLETLAEVRATVTQAETGQRGFLITGDAQYLHTYQAAAAQAEEQLLRLIRLTADSPEQESRVASLRALVKPRLKRLQENIAVRERHGFAAAAQKVGTDEGQALMDQIRGQIAAIKAGEDARLKTRAADSERSLRAKVWTNVAGTILGIAAVSLAFFLFLRRLAERRQAELQARDHALRQAAISELSQAALTDKDIDSLMDRAVHVTAQVLDVPLVKVLERLPDGKALRLRAGVGWRDGAVGTATVSAGLDSQAGYTLRASEPLIAGDLTTHQPIIVDDMRKETRFRGPALLSEHGVISGISVVIHDRPGRPFGILGAHTTAHRVLTADEDAPFVQAVANVLATAIRHRRAEEALRESERRFRALADSVPDIVWTSGPDGQCDYVNQRWSDLTGLSVEQALGLRWTSALHADDLQRSTDRWMRSMDSGEPFQCEYRFRAKDGGYRWCLARALPLRDEQERIVKWFGNCLDIDERRQLEDALREADSRKDRFLAVLAHELRNPLATIANAGHTLARSEPSQSQLHQMAALIDRQVRHLTQLIDDLSDVARIGQGKMLMRKEHVDVATVVNRAVEITRPDIESRHHHLAIELPEEPLWIEADPTRMAQVLGNLLANASKYTDEGGRIDLRVSREDSEVAVRVRDTGIGIPPEALDRVFDDFFQVEQSEKRSQGGLGIGLSLVRRLVELHEGHVQAFSDGPGRGAEFVVRLPALALDTVRPEHPPEATERPPASRRRVLVVDDHRLMADSLARVLATRGCEVRVAYSGPEALPIAAAFRPDLVFLDIGLPGMDGYELARHLRDDTALTDAVLVALSGYEPGTEQRAPEAGFDHYAVKPLNAQTLDAILAGECRAQFQDEATESAPELTG